MLKHTQIRSRILNILNSGLTDFKLYNARRDNIGDDLPALSVYTDGENAENTKDEVDSMRIVDVFVVFKDKHPGDEMLSTKLDVHSESIDNLLTKEHKNLRFGVNVPLVKKFWYYASRRTFESAAAESHGTVTMHFKALYYKEL